MNAKTTMTSISEVRSIISMEEAANYLYERLPEGQRLPGSPLLTLSFGTYGIQLIQRLEKTVPLGVEGELSR